MLDDGRLVLSVAIMHTPAATERVPMVAAIREQLPEAHVIEERSYGLNDTTLRAWAALDPRATHHLVLQDDARLCADFRARALAAIGERPTDALSFFSRPFGSTERWITGSWFTAVATCLPLELARAWIGWMRWTRCPDTDLVPWLRSRHLERWFVNPSLVQHGDVPSLIGHQRIVSESFPG